MEYLRLGITLMVITLAGLHLKQIHPERAVNIHVKLNEIIDQEPVPLRQVWDNGIDYPWGPQGENQRGMEIKRRALIHAEQNATLETIPYAALTSIETHVSPSRVQHYVDNPEHEIPFVYKHAGKLVLWDGTHRVTARIKAGHNQGPARVADLDDVLDERGRVKDPERFSQRA